jgi:lysophospholipase L1-like esterase
MSGIKNMLAIGAILPLLGILALDAAGETKAAQEGNQPTLTNVVRLLESGRDPVRIVCFGDSITGVYYHTGGRRAWGDMLGIALQQTYPRAKLELYNAGISGDTTTKGLARIDRDVLARKPHLVVVMFGMNDCTAANPRVFQDNLKTIVQRCRESGAAVVLCTPNSIYPEDKTRFANLPSCVDAVRAVAAEMPVPMADCFLAYENLRASDPLAWKLLMSETIHPCMNGHRLFAQIIVEAISGKKTVLDNVSPPYPALTFTFDRLSRKQPVNLIAMPPYDTIMPKVLRTIYPNAVIDITPWPTGALGEMEKWSKGIREKKPALVVVAIPANAQSANDETFIRSYNWILSWSLAFGVAQWDTIAILPSVTQPNLTGGESRFADLAQRVVAGRDIGFVERAARDGSEPEAILQRWTKTQHKSWTAMQGGHTRTVGGGSAAPPLIVPFLAEQRHDKQNEPSSTQP